MFGTFLLDEKRGWGVGYNAQAYFTTNAGLDWTLLNCGVQTDSLDDVWFINDSVGFVCGSSIFRLEKKSSIQSEILGESSLCNNGFVVLEAANKEHINYK